MGPKAPGVLRGYRFENSSRTSLPFRCEERPPNFARWFPVPSRNVFPSEGEATAQLEKILFLFPSPTDTKGPCGPGTPESRHSSRTQKPPASAGTTERLPEPESHPLLEGVQMGASPCWVRSPVSGRTVLDQPRKQAVSQIFRKKTAPALWSSFLGLTSLGVQQFFLPCSLTPSYYN